MGEVDQSFLILVCIVQIVLVKLKFGKPDIASLTNLPGRRVITVGVVFAGGLNPELPYLKTACESAQTFSSGNTIDRS